MTGTIAMRPMKAVRTPSSSDAITIASQINIGSLLRSTALIDVMTAVMLSTSRCMIIGSEKALAENVTDAKTAPTMEPNPRYVAQSRTVASPSVGKNTVIMTAARAHTRKITSSTSAKIISLPKWRLNAARRLRAKSGSCPRSSCALMAYRPIQVSGARNTKPPSIENMNH